MRILFLTSAHNSLSQRLLIELSERGHEIRVCVAVTKEAMIAAVSHETPDLILAPMLKIAVPKEIWSRHLCLIVHPGIRGDRGPSSLDWAIANHEKNWGVTILEAAEEFDAGAIWASHEFAVEENPPAKSSLYRGRGHRGGGARRSRSRRPYRIGRVSIRLLAAREAHRWVSPCARAFAAADAAGRPCHRLDAGQDGHHPAEDPRGRQRSWRPRHAARQKLLSLRSA